MVLPDLRAALLDAVAAQLQEDILEPGDEYAMHSGGIGGLTIDVSVHDPNLDPWKQWTEENFDRLWDN